MKTFYLVVVSIIFLSMSGYGQVVTFGYEYDAAGNRVRRTIIDMSRPPSVNNDSIPEIDLIEEDFAYSEDHKNTADNIKNYYEYDNNDDRQTYENNDIPEELKIKYRDLNINIYPNPVKERLFIEITGDTSSGNMSCELIDANGRIINNKILTSSREEIDFSVIPPGMYILRFPVKNDYKEYKVIKN